MALRSSDFTDQSECPSVVEQVFFFFSWYFNLVHGIAVLIKHLKSQVVKIKDTIYNKMSLYTHILVYT